MKPLMTLEEAAAQTPFSTKTLRRAIHTDGSDETLPPLKAKRDSRGRYLVRDTDLIAWLDAFPDA